MTAVRILVVLLPFVLTTLVMAQTVTVNFNDQEVGKPPQGFTTALTGSGKVRNWVIISGERDTSRGKVLAQTDMDPTGSRFPLCIYDGFSGKDVDMSVKFKPGRTAPSMRRGESGGV